MFKSARVGNRVWSLVHGWGKVIHINNKSSYPIIVGFDNGANCMYTFEGKVHERENQTLFWDEVKFELPESPFVLKDFLFNNLEPKKFEQHEPNYCFYYRHWNGMFCIDNVEQNQYFTCFFADKNIKIVAEELNKRAITFEELMQAFKELRWI